MAKEPSQDPDLLRSAAKTDGGGVSAKRPQRDAWPRLRAFSAYRLALGLLARPRYEQGSEIVSKSFSSWFPASISALSRLSAAQQRAQSLFMAPLAVRRACAPAVNSSRRAAHVLNVGGRSRDRRRTKDGLGLGAAPRIDSVARGGLQWRRFGAGRPRDHEHMEG